VVLKIAHKEFMDTIRDGRFLWSAGVVLVLLIASLAQGWRQYAQAKAQIETAQRQERERWLNQGEKYEHSAAHYGQFVFKPQRPLSALDQGVNAYVGTSVFIEAHKQNLSNYRPAADGLNLRRFGELSACAALQMLIPLLIVLLAYAAFVGEREAGTMRQLLSLGVRRRDIALGKALGLTGPLLIFLTPAAIVGAFAVTLNSGAPPSDDNLPRLLLMVMSYLLYFGIFVGVTIIVSTRASTSRQALLILISFWFINCLVAPQLVTDAARAIYPPPTGLEFETMMSERKQKLAATTQQRLAELERRLLKQYGVDNVRDLPVNFKGLAMLEDEEAQGRLQDEIFGHLYDIYDRHGRFYQAGAFVAPMMGVQSLSMGLAGTDLPNHRRFAQAAEEYRRRMLRTLNESSAATDPSKLREFAGTGIRISYAGREVWERLPPFSYTPPDVAAVSSDHRLSIAALLVWFLAVVIITPVAVAKARIF
jgi:ABC-2 type transport system permease protein